MMGKEGLLFASLNDSSQVDAVCLLESLPGL